MTFYVRSVNYNYAFIPSNAGMHLPGVFQPPNAASICTVAVIIPASISPSICRSIA